MVVAKSLGLPCTAQCSRCVTVTKELTAVHQTTHMQLVKQFMGICLQLNGAKNVLHDGPHTLPHSLNTHTHTHTHSVQPPIGKRHVATIWIAWACAGADTAMLRTSGLIMPRRCAYTQSQYCNFRCYPIRRIQKSIRMGAWPILQAHMAAWVHTCLCASAPVCNNSDSSALACQSKKWAYEKHVHHTTKSRGLTCYTCIGIS